MPRVKKDSPAPDPVAVAHAHAVVAENPRGAPITLRADELEVVPDPEAVAASVAEYVQAFDAAMPPRDQRPCALEDAPIGSKVVVLATPDGKQAVLTTPLNGSIPLPDDDMARKLPVGAKIRRILPSVFEAVQLNPQVPYPPLVRSSARVAIGDFVAHFHPRD